MSKASSSQYASTKESLSISPIFPTSPVPKDTGIVVNNRDSTLQPKVRMSMALTALLVYTVGVKYRGINKKERYATEHMFSLSENTANKFLKRQDGAMELIKHNRNHLVRIYQLRPTSILPLTGRRSVSNQKWVVSNLMLRFACRSGIYDQAFGVPAERTGWVCPQAGSPEKQGQEFACDQEGVLLERQGITRLTISE